VKSIADNIGSKIKNCDINNAAIDRRRTRGVYPQLRHVGLFFIFIFCYFLFHYTCLVSILLWSVVV